MNQKKSIALTTTFVGLVCGFVLTQQQAAAAATNAPDPTTTSMVASQSAATSKSAEPTQKEQPINQQTSTQKAVTNTENVSETGKQNQTAGTQTIGSSATTTTAQPATASNNPITSAPTQQAAVSSASKANETTQPVTPPTAPTVPQATKVTNSANTALTTTDSQQVETIAQGTWGTSKWEYTEQGFDYILHFHEGTFGASSHKSIKDPNNSSVYHALGSIGSSPEVFNGNWQWSNALTQIIIDPGVKANQDSSYLFSDLYKLQQIVGLGNLDTNNVKNMADMFDGCEELTNLDVSKFDTTNVTNMYEMFDDCSKVTSLDVSNFNTANVTDMFGMFEGCYFLTNLDLHNFNTANVSNMAKMFRGCSHLTNLDVSNFNTTNVTDMYWMFEYCSSLTSLDLSNFNTTKVYDMDRMFELCCGLTSLDLSNFDTANVTNMYEMFDWCWGLTNLDLSNFDTANVKNMADMFDRCSELTKLDLSHFNTSKVTSMWNMFAACDNLNHLILGPNMLLNTKTYLPDLPDVPETGTKIPGTNRRVTSPYWVATSGYQQGHKYTSNELMELTGRDQITTYDWDSAPAFTQTTETKTKDRTIVIHQPDGNTKTEIQSVMISRTITLNADGSKTYGNWSSAQWDGYAIPEFAGYTASVSQIPAQTVDGNTEDQTIDVYYAPQEQTVEIQYLANGQIVGTQKITGYTGDTIMPNYHAPQGYEITSLTPATVTIDGTGKQIIQVQVSPKLNDSVEHKTLTRTINLHLPDGTMRVSKQTALLERQVTINAVTGEKIYGAWNTGDWKALNVPTLAGYTASQDQVAAQQVTGADSDQTVDVYYTPNN
ncbi:uncharacterized protein JG30_06390 [Bombilactobacillus mellifer]|uniref:Mub B2-like domain-containing protein n=1 Tax=Bombilactobacillus mellifer TaxID=1218492 RepID=A0A0F4LVQ5_9LACO|nr:BspA family leucine-rich repeat surface protein [Bombilactobacillus mellifer]KJY62428.1 uncharacterized protein JG30_06390 [Bombilactobacillus mellifer]